MKLIKKTGVFNPDGEIFLHRGISVSWKFFSSKNIPDLQAGTPLDIDVSLDEHTILSGEYGIVWATWDQRRFTLNPNSKPNRSYEKTNKLSL
jgi:hypothetical protein